jgi:hypothetical protein
MNPELRATATHQQKSARSLKTARQKKSHIRQRAIPLAAPCRSLGPCTAVRASSSPTDRGFEIRPVHERKTRPILGRPMPGKNCARIRDVSKGPERIAHRVDRLGKDLREDRSSQTIKMDRTLCELVGVPSSGRELDRKPKILISQGRVELVSKAPTRGRAPGIGPLRRTTQCRHCPSSCSRAGTDATPPTSVSDAVS